MSDGGRGGGWGVAWVSTTQPNVVVQFSSVYDDIYANRKGHRRSTPCLRSFRSIAFETVLMLLRCDRLCHVLGFVPVGSFSLQPNYLLGHVARLRSVQFSLRWYLRALKSTYALHPSLRSFPNVAFETVPMFV